MEKLSPLSISSSDRVLRPTHFLEPQQVAMIDEALCSLGEFGEVRLIVERGRLITQRSYDALKWQPGSLSAER